MTQRKATLLSLTASSSELAPVLSDAASTVEQTEPGTLDWLAVDAGDANQYAVFDVFASQAARVAHFDGAVAATLTARGDELLAANREPGTLGTVNHYDVLAEVPARSGTPTLFTSIELRAAPGQAEALAAFLTGGASLVAESEPGTLRWFALRHEGDAARFAIVDWFADEAGRAAHFEGRVAAALKDAAATLVDGGWEAVLAAVRHASVLSSFSRVNAAG